MGSPDRGLAGLSGPGLILVPFDESATGADPAVGRPTGPNTPNNGGPTGTGGGKVGAVMVSPCVKPGHGLQTPTTTTTPCCAGSRTTSASRTSPTPRRPVGAFGADILSRPDCEPGGEAEGPAAPGRAGARRRSLPPAGRPAALPQGTTIRFAGHQGEDQPQGPSASSGEVRTGGQAQESHSATSAICLPAEGDGEGQARTAKVARRRWARTWSTSPTSSGAASEKLDAGVLGYFAGGAGDEETLRDNVAAWGRWRLRPRVLAGHAEWGTAAELLGAELSMPLLVAPVAYQRLVDPGGEVAMARAAAEAGTVMCLSTLATTRPGELAAAAPRGRRWFQLYCFSDRGVTRALMDEAVDSGFEAIVVTVDAPRGGNRERDLRTGFEIPAGSACPACRRRSARSGR